MTLRRTPIHHDIRLANIPSIAGNDWIEGARNESTIADFQDRDPIDTHHVRSAKRDQPALPAPAYNELRAVTACMPRGET